MKKVKSESEQPKKTQPETTSNKQENINIPEVKKDDWDYR